MSSGETIHNLLLAADQPRGRSRLEEDVVALFDQLRDPLLRYSLSFAVSVQDAEEIVQEAFLALFHHLRRDKSRANLRGWLFRVTHNLSLKRRQTPGRNFGADELTLPDPAPTPEEQVSAKQRHNRLQSVVRALAEQDRRCLYLRAEGLRYREIADVLGISLGGVSNSLTRSLARIREADEGNTNAGR